MARGKKTDADKVTKFRAEYLRLGNAARAARKVGLPVRTGQQLAKAADEDEEFAQLRTELYAREMAEVETLAADVARRSHARFCAKWEPPEPVEGSSITVKDPRPDYGKLVMDALRSMSQHRARIKDDDSSPLAKIELELVPYRPPVATDSAEPEDPPDPIS